MEVSVAASHSYDLSSTLSFLLITILMSETRSEESIGYFRISAAGDGGTQGNMGNHGVRRERRGEEGRTTSLDNTNSPNDFPRHLTHFPIYIGQNREPSISSTELGLQLRS